MQAANDLRAVLEAVVYGDDPRITPGERVRAAEQLQLLDAREQPQTFDHLLSGMPPQDAMRLYDEFLGAQEAEELLSGGPAAERRPVLAARLQAEVERRAQALLQAKLGDVEAEVERRANERAAQLYEARAFKLAGVHDAAVAATTAADSADAALAQPVQPEGATAPPPGLAWDDPSLAHYRPRKPRGGRLLRPGG